MDDSAITWLCPICLSIERTTVYTMRLSYGWAPEWFVERAGRRSLGLSHILRDHPYHARRDVLLRAIKDEADRDLDLIRRRQRAGVSQTTPP